MILRAPVKFHSDMVEFNALCMQALMEDGVSPFVASRVRWQDLREWETDCYTWAREPPLMMQEPLYMDVSMSMNQTLHHIQVPSQTMDRFTLNPLSNP